MALPIFSERSDLTNSRSIGGNADAMIENENGALQGRRFSFSLLICGEEACVATGSNDCAKASCAPKQRSDRLDPVNIAGFVGVARTLHQAQRTQHRAVQTLHFTVGGNFG